MIPTSKRLKRLGQLYASLVLAIGAVCISGWGFNVRVLRSVLPEWVQMKANAALCFVAAGASLLLILHDRRWATPRYRLLSRAWPRWCCSSASPHCSSTASPSTCTSTSSSSSSPGVSSDTRFRQAFASPMAGIAIFSDDGRVVDANDMLLEVLGRTRADIEAGRLFCTDLPRASAESGQHPLSALWHGAAEVEHAQPFGERLSVLVSASRPQNGEGTYFLLDVSDRKRSDEQFRSMQRDQKEQRLLRLQQQLMSAMAAAPDLRSLIDIALRVVSEASNASFGEAWLVVSGGLEPIGHAFTIDQQLQSLTHAGLVEGKAVADSLPMRALLTQKTAWSDLDELKTARAAVARDLGLRSAVAVPIVTGDEIALVLGFAFREAAAEDSLFHEVVNAVSSELGHAIGRKRADDALRASELRFRSVAQSASDAIVSLDEQGVVTSWNRAAEVIFGRTEPEMVGAALEVVLPERLREGHRKAMARIGSGGDGRQTGRAELLGLRRDGAEFPLEISMGSFATHEGRFFSGILRDMSDRKRAETELRQVNDGLRRTVDQLEERNRQAAELGLLAELLQSCAAVEDALKVLSDRLPRLFPGSSGSVLLHDSSRKMVEPAAAWGTAEPGQDVFAPEDCWALRRGRAHRSGPGGLVACLHSEGGEPRICAGLHANGEAMGLLTVRWSTLPPEHVAHAVAAVTDQVALALANLRLRDTLRVQAVRDALTGLYNRRHLEESLDKELRRANRKGRSLAVIMADVDHFKRLNDTHGHPVGDLVLREIAATMQGALRGDDHVCRYGGEEFVAVMPEATLADAVKRAEEIRSRVEALRIELPDGGVVRATISLGVAAHPQHGRTPAAMIGSADAALYLAKGAGRNRVVASEVQVPFVAAVG